MKKIFEYIRQIQQSRRSKLNMANIAEYLKEIYFNSSKFSYDLDIVEKEIIYKYAKLQKFNRNKSDAELFEEALRYGVMFSKVFYDEYNSHENIPERVMISREEAAA